MFLGTPTNLHLPALESKNFSIDFSKALHEQYVVLHLIMAMNPSLEGQNLGYVKVTSEEDTRALYFIVHEHGRKDFKGQVRTLRKILSYRKLTLADYRIVAPAWDEEIALEVDRLQRNIREIDSAYTHNGYVSIDYLFTRPSFVQIVKEMDELIGDVHRHTLNTLAFRGQLAPGAGKIVDVRPVPVATTTALRLYLRNFAAAVRRAFTLTPRQTT